MAEPTTDRNLLLGVLALEAKLIDHRQFIEACSAWAASPQASLADILFERGWLSHDGRTDLERMLQSKLEQHGGDARAGLATLAEAPPRDPQSTNEDLDSRSLCDSSLSRETLASGQGVSGPPVAGGRYTRTRLYATGGIGRVWLARDGDLGREVALKDLRPERSGTPAVEARFVQEAKVTGQLEHPGIVPVYELARDADGRPFYAMRFVQGRTFTQAIRAYHGKHRRGEVSPLDLLTLVNSFVAVCNALAYAHARGVIHRDLKGQNVVLGDFGEVVVLDWGLAKVGGAPDPDVPPVTVGVPQDREATLQGQVLGTPAYMAPEQAAGRLDLIDRRTDVYGLGTILYEILAGRPPFAGPNTPELLRQVANEAPPPPRRIFPGAPPALEAVCLRAMARKPGDRYPSVADLARDVQHWVADEPVEAYAEPASVKLGRWARRHQSMVAGAAALLVTAVAALSVSTFLIGREQAETAKAKRQADANADDARDKARLAEEKEAEATKQAGLAETRRLEAEERYQLSRRSVYAAQLSQAALLSEHEPRSGLDLLADRGRCPADLRDVTWDFLYALCRRDRATLPEGYFANTPTPFLMAPDGRTVAVLGPGLFEKRSVKLCSIVPGQEGALLPPMVVLGMPAFAPDGKTVAVATPDRELQFWDLATATQTSRVRMDDTRGPLRVVAFSPDLRLAATAGLENTVQVRDAATGKPRLALEGLAHPAWRLAFSPDGKLLATWGIDLTRLSAGPSPLQLWDVAGGGEERTLKEPGVDGVKQLLFTPDGGTLLAIDRLGSIRVWDTRTGQTRPPFWEQQGLLQEAVMAPDGKTLALNYEVRLGQGRLKLWDVSTGRYRPAPVAEMESFLPLAFSPDGATLVTADVADSLLGPKVRLWDVATGKQLSSLNGRGPAVFTPDGATLVTGGGQISHPAVTVWDVRPGQKRDTLVARATAVTGLAYSPDGVLAVAGGQLCLADAATGETRALLLDGAVSCPTFSADGKTLAAAAAGSQSGSSVVHLWDPTGRPRASLPVAEGNVSSLAFSPDGKKLAAGWRLLAAGKAPRGGVRVWDPGTGAAAADLAAGGDAVSAVAFSPDGATLAAAGRGGVHLWDATRLEDRGLLETGPARHLAFSPDGRTLAVALDERAVALWDLAKRQVRLVLRGRAGDVNAVAFSPDGNTLAVAGDDRTVTFWDPVTGQVRAAFQRHNYPVRCLAFAANGRRLATGGGIEIGGEVLLWHTDPRLQERDTLLCSASDVTALTFAPDGHTLVAGATDRKFDSRGGHFLAGETSLLLKRWELGGPREDSPRGTTVAVPPADHTARLLTAGFSRGGSLLALESTGWAARQQGPLKLWDLDAQTERVLLERKAPGEQYVASLSPAANLAAVGTRLERPDYVAQVKLWDWGRDTTRVLLERPGWVGDVVVAPDGKTLLVKGGGGTLQLLDATTGKERAALKGQLTQGLVLSFSPDGKLLATTGEDRKVRIWDTADGREQSVLQDFKGGAAHLIISPDGASIAVAGSGPLRLWETATGKERPRPEKADGGAIPVFSPDGKILAVPPPYPQRSLQLWDVEAGKPRAVLAVSQTAVGPLAFSPDGKTLAVAGRQGTAISLWDVATAKERAVLKGHLGTINSLVFTPDGKTLAAADRNRTVKLWDVHSGRERATLIGHMDDVLRLSVSPDGRTLTSGSSDSVRVWDLETGAEKGAFVTPSGGIHAAFTPDGRGVLVPVAVPKEPDGEVWLCPVEGDKAPTRLEGQSGSVWAVRFSADGGLLAAGGGDGAVRLWDTTTGARRAVLTGHAGAVRGLAFRPDGRCLAAAGDDGVIKLWDLDMRQTTRTIPAHGGAVDSLAFSPDGRLLASSGHDLSVRVWEVATGRQLASFHGQRSFARVVSFSPDGRLLAGAFAEGVVKLWDCDPDKLAPRRPAAPPDSAAPEALRPVALTADGKVVYRGNPDGSITRWDSGGGQRLLEGRHREAVQALALSPDGTTLASTGRDGSVKLHDTASGRVRLSLKGHPLPVRCLAFSPDGALLASGEAPPRNLFRSPRPAAIKLWEVTTGEERSTLTGHGGGVWALAFSHDGKTLVSGSEDTSVRLWDTGTGRPRAALPAHAGPVCAVAFSLDGRTLATSTYLPSSSLTPGPTAAPRWGSPVRLWDAQTLREQAPFLSRETAWFLAFSPDGRRLVAACDDGGLLWGNLANRSEAVLIRAHAGLLGGAAATPGFGRVATAEPDGTVRLWETPADPQRFPVEYMPGGSVAALSGSPDGKTLLLAVTKTEPEPGKDRRLKTASEVRLLDPRSGRVRTTLAGDDGAVSLALFSADGKTVLTVGGPRPPQPGRPLATARLWDPETGEERSRVDLPAVWGTPMAVAADFKTLAWGAVGGGPTRPAQVRLVSLETGKEAAGFPAPAGPVTTLALSADDRLLAAASENGTVQVWDVGTRQEVRSFTGLKNRVRSLAFSPDGKRLAGASLPDFGAGQVKIWEVDSGRETGSCNGVYPPVNGLRFSPDGNRLAAFGSQDMLKILDGTSGAELVLVSGRGVHAWLGGRLATAAPGAVLLWDAGLGQPRATLAGLP